MQWICCQIGAREHYAIPRVLQQENELSLLVSDAWAGSWLPWGLGGGRRAAERFHPGIPSEFVESFDWSLLRFELRARRLLSGWALIMARNEWFQSRALAALRRFRDRHPGRKYVLFSYSYAAAQLFEFAKQAGWTTVLGQIDPGPFEEKIVVGLHKNAGCEGDAGAAPAAYWDQWRNECRLADRILVNSDWSRHGLQAEGVAPEKLLVLPLGYDRPLEAANFTRIYPVRFTPARPLRVLFLGQVNLRKGLLEILGAISRLQGEPVEFWIVGGAQFPIRDEYQRHPHVKWFGPVSRSATANFYRDADVFLFPTFSDGFGLTQLEAQSWSLPVIASRRCGGVVQDGVNGYLLPEITAEDIARAIKGILADPGVLGNLAARSRATDFTLDKLSGRLRQVCEEANSCCRS